MLLKYFVVAFLTLGIVAADDGMLSKECTFTKSKPNSCIYFVMKEDMIHKVAADYCFEQFNGALIPIFHKYEEGIEVMKRYYWWANSSMNVQRLRFGMWNKEDDIFRYTKFNPLKHVGKDVDMHIWRRSFPIGSEDEHYLTFDKALYDETLPYKKPHYVDGDSTTYEYLALKPATMKWSRANFHDKIPFICEVPRFPKAYCEPGWWLHMKSRSCFFLNTQRKNFQDAAMHCRQIGSNLASINDETENNMALKMIQQQTGNEDKRIWFGLRHDAIKLRELGNDERASSGFPEYFAKNLGYNVDGTPVSTYTNFHMQPGGVYLRKPQDRKENCFFMEELSLTGGVGSWNFNNCETTSAWSLCRKMASTQPYHS